MHDPLFAAASLTLAACGSGGETASSLPDRNPKIVILPSAGPVAQIARARPRPGSVTQSSNIGPDGITLDKVALTKDTKSIVSNGDNWTVTFNEAINSSEPFDTGYTIANKAPQAARRYNLTKSFAKEAMQNPFPKVLGSALIRSELRCQPWGASREAARAAKVLATPGL